LACGRHSDAFLSGWHKSCSRNLKKLNMRLTTLNAFAPASGDHLRGEIAMKSDALIKHEIRCELKWDTHVDESTVVVAVDLQVAGDI
jgi:hypothetical protein